MSAQHVAIPVYVRTIRTHVRAYARRNFAWEDTMPAVLLPLVRRAYRGSRSIGVLFSRDLRLIRASPQLLIELWNCIPMRDDVAVGGGGGGEDGGGEWVQATATCRRINSSAQFILFFPPFFSPSPLSFF